MGSEESPLQVQLRTVQNSFLCVSPPLCFGSPREWFLLGPSQVEAKTQRYGRVKGQTKISDECWRSEVFCSQRLVTTRVGGRMSSWKVNFARRESSGGTEGLCQRWKALVLACRGQGVQMQSWPECGPSTDPADHQQCTAKDAHQPCRQRVGGLDSV